MFYEQPLAVTERKTSFKYEKKTCCRTRFRVKVVLPSLIWVREKERVKRGTGS